MADVPEDYSLPTMIDGVCARTRIGAKVTGTKHSDHEGRVGVITRVNRYGVIFVRWPHSREMAYFPESLTYVDGGDHADDE